MEARRKNESTGKGQEKVVTIKQCLLRNGTGNILVTQSLVDKMLLDLIIEEMLPTNLVDKPSFIIFSRLGLPSSIRIMSKDTLKTKIEKKFVVMIENVKQQLSKVDVVCTTVDFWSKSKK